MKNIFLVLVVLSGNFLIAQKPIGVFGKTQTFGLSLEMQQPFKSKYAIGRLVKPMLHYMWAVDRYRFFSCEIGAFTLGIKSTSPSGDKVLKINSTEMEDGLPRYIYPVNFKGRGRAIGYEFGFYRNAANWVGLGPLGSYHSWGFHLASIGYKKDNFTYTYLNENEQLRDTSYGDLMPQRKLVLSFSLSFGGKTTFKKDKRLVWDYGLRFRIPIIGHYSPDADFFIGKEMVIYHAVRNYKQGGLCMLYTGVHYAF